MDDLQWWEDTFNRLNGDITYMIAGKEKCTDTERKHIQGYLQLKEKKRLKPVQELLQIPGLHLAAAHSTAAKNIVYCSKEKDFKEWGEVIHKGIKRPH